ncbi:MAG: HEPN domain-containing protein [Bacteroidetes bacterium]|nr:HEPN domain-containing protein [Bacteroidota bacterium]
MNKKEHILSWLEKVEHDFSSAQVLFEHNPLVLDVPCFLCQQSVEKYLKAYLFYNSQDIEKTHDCEFLLEKCGHFDPDFRGIDLKNINDFAVDIRYPDEAIAPDHSQAMVYLQITEKIRDLVRSKISFE